MFGFLGSSAQRRVGRLAGGAAVGSVRAGVFAGKVGWETGKAALGTVFRAPPGKLMSPALKGAIGYLGWTAAGDTLERYADGNFEHDSSKMVAGGAATLLRLKGLHSGAIGATRTIGEIGARYSEPMIGSSNKYVSKLGSGFKGLADAFRGPGFDTREYLAPAKHGTVQIPSTVPNRHRYFNPAGRTKYYNRPSSYTGRGPALPREVATRLSPREGGAIDSAMSFMDPFKLAAKGAKLAFSGARSVVGLPGKAIYGSYEHARNFYRADAAYRGAGGGFAGARQGWVSFNAGLGTMHHELAPVIMGGAALGATNSILRRNMIGDDWASMPTTGSFLDMDGGAGAEGSVDPNNFGGGIVETQGSPITSRTVMEGQQAVTSKMLNRRRV